MKKQYSILLIALILMPSLSKATQLNLGSRAFSNVSDIISSTDISVDFQSLLTKNELDWLRGKPKVRVGVVAPLTRPLEFVTSSKYLEGMSADVLALFSRLTDCHLEVMYFETQQSALEALASDKVDFLSINSILPSLLNKNSMVGVFTDEIIKNNKVYLVGKKGSDTNDSHVNRLAYIKDSINLSDLHKIYPEATFKEFSNVTDAVDAVLFEQADFFIGNRFSINYINGSRFGNLSLFKNLNVEGKPLAFYVSRNDKKLASVLGAFVEAFQVNGLFNVLDLKWGGGGRDFFKRSKMNKNKEYSSLHQRPIKIGLVQKNIPYSFIDERGSWTGIIPDILDNISYVTGVSFEIIPFSDFASAKSELLNGNVDLVDAIPSYIKSIGVKGAISYNIDDTLVIVASEKNNFSSDVIHAAAKHNISEIKKSSLLKNDVNIKSVNTDFDVLNGISLGDIDVGIVSLYAAEYFKHHSKIPYYIKGKVDGYNIERTFLVRENDPLLLDFINDYFSSLSPSYLSSISYHWRYGPRPSVSFYALYGHIIRPALYFIIPFLIVYVVYSYRLAIALKNKERAEESLSAQLEMMRHFLDGIPHPVLLVSTDNSVMYCNKMFTSIFSSDGVLPGKEWPLSTFITNADDFSDVSEFILRSVNRNEVLVREVSIMINGFQRDISDWFIPYKSINESFTGAFWGWFDVTWRNEAYAEMVKAREQADLASQAKTEFISTISHEIRTPINIVNGFLDFFILNDSLSLKEKEELGYVRSATNGLLELVGNVLDVTKIEAGLLELDRSPVLIKSFMDEIISTFRLIANNRNIEITTNFRFPMSCTLLIDPMRLRQILYNIISNAIKFTRDNGSVNLDASYVNGDFQIIVSDTGIGISEDKINSLFKPFRQAHIDTDYQGSGLGLNICKRLCELMGGGIELSSITNVGTTVNIIIPCDFLSDSTMVPHSLLNVDSNNLICFDGMKVLIVDDHEVNLILLSKQLKYLGFTVFSSNSALHALDMLHSDSFDLVLTDCQMPGMDGFEFAKKIRRMDSNSITNSRTVVIVGLTASGLRQDRDRALVCGMDECMFKPINVDGLRKALAGLLTSYSEKARKHTCDVIKTDASLLSLIKQSTKDDLSTAEQYLKLKDVLNLLKVIHRIKGVFLMVDISEQVAICMEIESELECNCDWVIVHEKLCKIRNNIERLT